MIHVRGRSDPSQDTIEDMRTTLIVTLAALCCSVYCTCLRDACTPSSILTTSINLGSFTDPVCEDLKTYVYCLVQEYDGCFEDSEEKTALLSLTAKYHAYVVDKCELTGGNGVCDITDCVFFGNLSTGVNDKLCKEMEQYLLCLDTELEECGSTTIYGSRIESLLDGVSWQHDSHCDAVIPGPASDYIGVILSSLLVVLTSRNMS